MRKIFICILVILFLVPYLTNICFELKKNSRTHKKHSTDIHNKLDKTQDKIINNIELEKNSLNNKLENYLIGVVAAEMPASFELEALKAQAVASRTYAIKNYDGIDYRNLYQAYIDINDLKDSWGQDFDKNYKKIARAVKSTAGETIKYNQEMIEAVFHSTSAGQTENSENVWQKSLPYLKSVDSHEDINAPSFISQKKFLLDDFIKKINSKYNTTLTKQNFINNFIIAQRTKAGYIKTMNICGKNINAMDLRFFLGLRSTNFNFNLDRDKKNIIFITKGFGHGAGMSQYGANFMAKNGCDYKKILKHYYTGVEIY